MATREKLATLLMGMYHLPQCPLNDENAAQVIGSYLEVLIDIDDEMVEAAALAYKATATFFPTPADLRKSATRLFLAGMGVPTAAEAWAMVLKPHTTRLEPVRCEEAERIYEEALQAEPTKYLAHVRRYNDHTDACAICTQPERRTTYDHPVVGKVVELLGGRGAILTDNIVADRARFIAAYDEMIERLTLAKNTPPQVLEITKRLLAPTPLAKLLGSEG